MVKVYQALLLTMVFKNVCTTLHLQCNAVEEDVAVLQLFSHLFCFLLEEERGSAI